MGPRQPGSQSRLWGGESSLCRPEQGHPDVQRDGHTGGMPSPRLKPARTGLPHLEGKQKVRVLPGVLLHPDKGLGSSGTLTQQQVGHNVQVQPKVTRRAEQQETRHKMGSKTNQPNPALTETVD